LETALKEIEFKPIYTMGDLNNTADIRNKGYDLITKAGWEGNNVPFRCASTTSSRTRPQAVETYEVKFDGKKLPCMSDHYGVAVTYS